MARNIKYDWKDYDVDSLAEDNIDRLSTSMIPPHAYVLELGCATGFLTKYLKQNKQCAVVGVERNAAAAKKAKNYAKHVIVGNLDAFATWRHIKKLGPFDVVYASSVIEHLQDPWSALRMIHTVLTPEGFLVLTIPNIAFWRARIKLLLGRWEYEDYGIFDRTHTKFFTLFSMRKALAEAGFFINEEKYDPAGGAKWFTPILRFFPNAYAHQIAFRARKI